MPALTGFAPRLVIFPRLDFKDVGGQESAKVFAAQSSFYSVWRAERLSALALRERAAGRPPESLVRAIWQHQRLRRDAFRTPDGVPVRVWHPGFPNAEPGPDFRGAIVQVGDAPPRSGDVEVDLETGGWRAHGHDRNPAFANVVLHVVWDAEGKRDPARPVLALRDVLDAPLDELTIWLDLEPARAWPESLRGQCSAPLKELPREKVEELLHQAARVRFESKAAQLRARAREAGWEQAFWEGMFRALGYKHNVWPMHHLAESRERWAATGTPVLAWQARLLGLSNLLPADVSRGQSASDGYVRDVWDCWWRDRDALEALTLPRAAWRLAGLRPANHPQRRLALAAHWLAQGNLLARLEAWFVRSVPKARLAPSLLEALRVERDEFWSRHWTFRSARFNRPQPLLGEPRATDLAMNVVLPWFWVRAVEGRNETMQREAGRRYADWPLGEDNARLKFARQRLLGGGGGRLLPGAAAQQGLLQVLRDFCDQSNALCEQCRFPGLVRNWDRERRPDDGAVD